MIQRISKYRLRHVKTFQSRKSNIWIFLLIILGGCGEAYEIDELYVQRVYGSQNVIYKYYASSKYNDSEKFGYAVQDSTDTILYSKLEKLPIRYIERIKDENLIEGYNLVKPFDKLKINKNPLRVSQIKTDEIVIQVKDKEFYPGYSDLGCLLQEYSFQNFTETKDSLILIGIYPLRESVPEFPDNTARFHKGNIVLVNDYRNKDNLVRIRIDYLVESNGRPKTLRHENTDIEMTNDKIYMRCIRTYNFLPEKRIKMNEFSDYGFFKKIR